MKLQRESSLIATIRTKLPEFAKECADDTELVLLHQGAFAADYQRRTGLPPSESVSSWYPSWMCESRSCSVSVSFDERLAAFFFAILHVHYGGLILYVAKSYYWEFGAAANSISLPKAKPPAIGLLLIVPSIRSRDVATALVARCPARRGCALTTRFRQWSVQLPSMTISTRTAVTSIRGGFSIRADSRC